MRNTCPVWIPLWCRRAAWWPAWAWLLTACTLDAEKKAPVALPTGHYEGQVSYQGTELRTVLDLRETRPGQLEADLHFPEVNDLDFSAANLAYTEPQLRFDEGLPIGGINVTAVREGDFLRGVFTLDSIRVDFVWVRRGQPEPRAYQEKQLPAQPRLGTPPLTLLMPNDTARQHTALALFTDAAHLAAATVRAGQLAGQGFITTVVTVAAPSAAPDSVTLRSAAAVLLALRRAPATDTTRIGLWAAGTTAAAVAPAAVLLTPAAAFVVLERVPVGSAEEGKPFQELGRRRIPVLGLYAAADTTLNVKESARRLRAAVGSRGSIRTFAQADATFRVPGSLSSEGKWTWPRPAAGYVDALRQWQK